MVHVNDIGTKIRIVPSTTDISAATSPTIRYVKPSGKTGTWTASIVTGGIQYTTVANDLDEAGDWKLQGFIDLSTWVGATEAVYMKVGSIINP